MNKNGNTTKKRGYFIVLEGGEGSGKSTQAKLMSEYLNNKGFDSIILTREPGGIDTAEKIREIILNQNIDPITEALLFASARREHLVKKIKPALENGSIVICDRFVYSSLAYQGYARNIGIETVYNLNLLAIEDCLPDLTLMLELDPKQGLDRIFTNRANETNRLDKESLDFHLKVKEGYKIISDMYSNELEIINASKSIECVFEDIKSILNKKLQIV